MDPTIRGEMDPTVLLQNRVFEQNIDNIDRYIIPNFDQNIDFDRYITPHQYSASYRTRLIWQNTNFGNTRLIRRNTVFENRRS